MKDKYDRAIEILENSSKDEIEVAWGDPWQHEAGCLFQFATVSGKNEGNHSGCLTMFRSGNFHREVLGRPDLTKEIKNDLRIPQYPWDITVSDLPIFAEWQRRLDKELGRPI